MCTVDFWHSFWNIIWFFIWSFVFVAYLMALFSIVADLFRDRELNGWWKAVWLLFLVFVPFLTALVYLIARGQGMAERNYKTAAQNKTAAENYIRNVAQASPSEEIAKGKALLDSGTITPEEFEHIKRHALSNAHVTTAQA
jgi:hypothetical protein